MATSWWANPEVQSDRAKFSEAVIASGWWPKGRIASTVDACALIIKAMGELTDERPH